MTSTRLPPLTGPGGGLSESDRLRLQMKEIEDMVTKARLDQIAREHKSIGAVLDDRVLYKIEEPKRRGKKTLGKSALQLMREAEQQKEREENNGGTAQTDTAALSFTGDKTVPLAGVGDYTTELQIWKEKSGPAAYSQQRRFQHPDLQKFKESLTHEQLVQFRRRCQLALIALADKFRDECRTQKSDMDINGVFHPEANAHRAHCIYLMKLYKGIRSDTIEDPVLRQMRFEQEQRIAQEAALKAQKEELLRSMEATEFANMNPAQQEAALAAEAKRRAEQEGGAPDRAEGEWDQDSQASGKINNNSNDRTSATAMGPTQSSDDLNEIEDSGSPMTSNKASGVHFSALSSGKFRTADKGSAKYSNTPKNTPKLSSDSKSGKFGSASTSVKVTSSSSSLEANTSTKSMGKSSSMPVMSAINSDGNSLKQSASSQKIRTSFSESTPSTSSKTNTSGNLGSAKIQTVTKNNGPTPRAGRKRILSGISEGDLSLDRSSQTSHSHSLSPDRDSTSKDKDKLHKSKKNDKLFKLIKANKLGAVDPQTLLVEEAAKLQLGESFSMKKPRDKNNILETEMSNWMLSTVQKSQISKTTSGTAMLTSSGLSDSLKLPIPSIVSDFNDALKRASGSPSKMLPFDQFHEMFRTYSNVGAESMGSPTTGGGNKDGTGTRDQTQAHSASVEHTTSTTTTKKKSKRRHTEGSVTHDLGSSIGSLSDDDSGSIRSKNPNNLHIDTDTAVKLKPGHVEPTNLVKTLAEHDPNFEAYLKIASHPDPAASSDGLTRMRNKLNATIAPPRRVRKSNPLGQNAVNLVDSRGKASKDAKKGFLNIFQQPEEPEDDVDKTGVRIDSHIHIVGTDDVMSRLSNIDQEDDNASLSSTESIERDLSPNRTQKISFSFPVDSPSSQRDQVGMDATFSPEATALGSSAASSRNNSRSGSRRRLLGSVDGSSRRGTATGSSKSRKSGKLAFDGDNEEEVLEVIPPPGPDQGMQDKLMAAWECLLMPAAQRFGFMKKYSTDEYSMEMGRAVDMWSECAVLVVCIVELMKVLNKIKSGNCIMPLTKFTVLNTIRSKIPPLLASKSEYFIPPSLGYYDPRIPRQTVPLSAGALQSAQDIIEGMFQQKGQSIERKGQSSSSSSSSKNHSNMAIHDSQDALSAMQIIVTDLCLFLKKSLKATQAELGDIPPYGQKGCKEWVFGIAAIVGINKNLIDTSVSADEFEY